MQIEKFGRLLHPNHTIEASVIVKKLSGSGADTSCALYCNTYPLSDEDIQLFYAMADSGPMHFLFSKRLPPPVFGCETMDVPKGMNPCLESRIPVAAKLKRLVMAQAAESANSYMAIALLYCLGNSNLVDPKWIDTIARNQRDDGSHGLNIVLQIAIPACLTPQFMRYGHCSKMPCRMLRLIAHGCLARKWTLYRKWKDLNVAAATDPLVKLGRCSF